jgi:hypothetical protein
MPGLPSFPPRRSSPQGENNTIRNHQTNPEEYSGLALPIRAFSSALTGHLRRSLFWRCVRAICRRTACSLPRLGCSVLRVCNVDEELCLRSVSSAPHSHVREPGQTQTSTHLHCPSSFGNAHQVAHGPFCGRRWGLWRLGPALGQDGFAPVRDFVAALRQLNQVRASGDRSERG